MLGGSYFRSSKICLALAAVVMFIILYRALSRMQSDPLHPARPARWMLPAFFAVAMAACLLDRQGVFLVAMAAAFLFAAALSLRNRPAWLYAIVAALVLILSETYNRAIAPAITKALNDYQPSLAYQKLDWSDLGPFHFWYGWDLLLDTVRFMSGGLPAILAAVPLVLVFLAFRGQANWSYRPWRQRRIAASPRLAIAALIAGLLLLVLLNTLMVLRHRPLVWPDVRRVYYWLPACAILLMLFALAVRLAYRRSDVLRPAVQVMLIAMIIGNIAALPGHTAIVRGGHLTAEYNFAPSLLEGLNRSADPTYSPPPQVAADKVFQFYKERLGSNSTTGK